ncbi:hypothetical protein AVEN_213228-1 [Araneus ventricosus]|uniref:Uncharacterized protein n=1 Tax=Araneus ventricosus TaxID=182803 RepID=A0A4Y2JSG3_ARAVE|nr:hypothetical protein AVEN_213228-1 [Araneus ventricosus]
MGLRLDDDDDGDDIVENTISLISHTEGTQIAKKVAISLSISCPRKYFRANRFGNHSRKIDVDNLLMNHLSHRVYPRPVYWLVRLPSNSRNAGSIPGSEKFEACRNAALKRGVSLCKNTASEGPYSFPEGGFLTLTSILYAILK